MIHRHILKLDIRYAGEILRGRKRFEVRNNDRSFQRGDEVVFTAVDRNGDPVDRTDPEVDSQCRILEETIYRITFVVTGYGLKEGYCAFGFEDIEEGI